MANTCEQALKEKTEQLHQAQRHIAEMERFQNTATKEVRVKVGPVEGEVTKDDTWQTIGMLVISILAIYLGIKLINKYIR